MRHGKPHILRLFRLVMPWLTAALAISILLSTPVAMATSIDMSPLPVILLPSGDFLAYGVTDNVTLYRGTDGKPIRSYHCPGGGAMAATADGKWLIIACGSGDGAQIRCYSLQSGALAWQMGRTADRYLGPPSLSADGRYFVVPEMRGTLIGDVRTGQITRAIPGLAFSAALSPDGSKGAMIAYRAELQYRGELQLFDVGSGKVTITGVAGTPPISYSADGRFIAFRSNAPRQPALRVAPSDDPSKFIDVVVPGEIGHIKPAPDGRFLVTVGLNIVPGPSAKGLAYDPVRNLLQALWTSPIRTPTSRPTGEKATDFDAGCTIGVSTNYLLVTDVIDLQKGTCLYTIDNYPNSPLAIQARRDRRNTLITVAVASLALLAAAIVAIYGIRRAIAAHRMPAEDSSASL